MNSMNVTKIANLYSCCKSWKPARNAKGYLLKDKACWSCYFNLFAYCWLESKDNKLVSFALEDTEMAKQELHKRIEKLEASQ